MKVEGKMKGALLRLCLLVPLAANLFSKCQTAESNRRLIYGYFIIFSYN
jgi:predicted permease